MHFKELISNIAKDGRVDLFVDMDGVIASYDILRPFEFDKKRALIVNINTLREVSKIDGVKMYILSVCREDIQVKEKNDWLDRYASFFEKENRFILSKETIINTSSANMKLNFLREFKSDGKVVLVDDDNFVLKTICKNMDNIILFQDSELID